MIADIEQKWLEANAQFASAEEMCRKVRRLLDRWNKSESDPIDEIYSDQLNYAYSDSWMCLLWTSPGEEEICPDRVICTATRVTAFDHFVQIDQTQNGWPRYYADLPEFVVRKGQLRFLVPDANPVPAYGSVKAAVEKAHTAVTLRRLLSQHDRLEDLTREQWSVFDRAVEVLERSLGLGSVPPDWAKFTHNQLDIAWLRAGWRYEIESPRLIPESRDAAILRRINISDRITPIDPRYTVQADVARLRVTADRIELFVKQGGQMDHHSYDANRPFVVALDKVAFHEPDGTVSVAPEARRVPLVMRPRTAKRDAEASVGNECDSSVVIE